MTGNSAFFFVFSAIIFCISHALDEFRPWSYECDKFSRCIKKDLITDEWDTDSLSLGKCKLTCHAHAVLWPRPRKFEHDGRVTRFQPHDIVFSNGRSVKNLKTRNIIQDIIEEQVGFLWKKKTSNLKDRPQGVLLKVEVNLEAENEVEDEGVPKITRNTDESYRLEVRYEANMKEIKAMINAPNYFGARHGLETLFQLMEHDDVGGAFVILSNVQIEDYPAYQHRGISVDTCRNFIEPEVLKRLISALAHDKMNVFHWHIVDSQSFPVEHKTWPISQMTNYGAYSSKHVYTQETIKEIVDFANIKGVRVIPELDQPAHVGYGWNFPEAEAEDLVVCLGKEPWYDYCLQPGCGQLNPTKDIVYDYLEMIYKEWRDMFGSDSFHMGADEVHFGCWNSSSVMTDWMEKNGYGRELEGFIRLWKEFQQKSSDRLKKVYSEGGQDDLQIIVWSSDLTKTEHIHNLPKETYTVHVWNDESDLKDTMITSLIENGYKMVFSNFDQLYLDCGFGAYVGEGNNWCTPYKGWQMLYSFDPEKIVKRRGFELTDEIKSLLTGAEAPIWTEQVDSMSVEARMYPRASALAERLWSNPSEGWYEAEQRILQQRLRLTHRGVMADKLQPEWCLQNESQCYVKKDNPTEQAPPQPRRVDE